MKSLTLQSPAKLNLYLEVLNKRKDGFHNIVTVFERIDLVDKIRLTSNSRGTIKIRCRHPHVPVGPKNLMYKAARLFQQDCGIKKGVNINLNKKIPVAAGLGGGSSNAASVLLGLNRLWNLRLSKRQLTQYAKKLGSDVPFFVHQYRWGIGRNRGDAIKELKIKTKLWHILVVPHIKLYSARVYGALKISLTKKNDSVNILVRQLKNNNILNIGQYIINDLEGASIRLCPKLKKIQERLKLLNTQGVMVSGSGPSVFGVTTSARDAKSIKKILAKRYSQVFVVRTL